MYIVSYYFPGLSTLLEFGIEPAMLFGMDCWDSSEDSAPTTCVSIYFGPLVLSLHF